MKKKIAFIFAMLFLMSAFCVMTSADDIIYGDVTGDGKVNISDAVLFAQYLAEWDIVFDANAMKAADVFYDKSLNVRDAVLLSQYLAGWDVVLGDGPFNFGDIEYDQDKIFS